jgi:hypothetical protein
VDLKRHDAKRYRPPIPPQALDEMKPPCEWKTTMPKMRDGSGIGGQMFADVPSPSSSLIIRQEYASHLRDFLHVL